MSNTAKPALDVLHGEFTVHRFGAAEPLPEAVEDVAPCFVARTDLAQFHPRAELAGKVAHELPEVDAVLGGEVERDLLLIELPFDIDELHRQAQPVDGFTTDVEGFPFGLAVGLPAFDVGQRGLADEVRELARFFLAFGFNP